MIAPESAEDVRPTLQDLHYTVRSTPSRAWGLPSAGGLPGGGRAESGAQHVRPANAACVAGRQRQVGGGGRLANRSTVGGRAQALGMASRPRAASDGARAADVAAAARGRAASAAHAGNSARERVLGRYVATKVRASSTGGARIEARRARRGAPRATSRRGPRWGASGDHGRAKGAPWPRGRRCTTRMCLATACRG